MKYIHAATICFFIVTLVLIGYCRADVGEGFNGEVFNPVLEAHYVDTSYTTWNKGWLLAAILGQAGDIISTDYALSHGAEEANPLFGKNPGLPLLIGVKAGLVGVAWLLSEYVVPEKDRQNARNYIFAPLAVFGIGATVWNTSQILK